MTDKKVVPDKKSVTPYSFLHGNTIWSQIGQRKKGFLRGCLQLNLYDL